MSKSLNTPDARKKQFDSQLREKKIGPIVRLSWCILSYFRLYLVKSCLFRTFNIGSFPYLLPQTSRLQHCDCHGCLLPLWKFFTKKFGHYFYIFFLQKLVFLPILPLAGDLFQLTADSSTKRNTSQSFRDLVDLGSSHFTPTLSPQDRLSIPC